MALENGNLSAADVAAVTGNNGNWFGGDGSFWIIVLFLFALMGNGWGGNWCGNGGGAMPYMFSQTTNADVQRGFDQTAIMAGINGINTGLANAEVSRCNMLYGLTNQLNNIAMNQQNCCCENRLQIANLGADLAREACADRAAVADGTRDILENQNRNTQLIIDKLCQQEINALKTQNQNLQTQLNLQALNGSQNAQTAEIISALSPKAPIAAYTVPNPYGCNCGNNFYGNCCGA